MNPKISCELYNSLCRSAREKKLSDIIPASHNSLFLPQKHNYEHYKNLYLDQIASYRIGHKAKRRPKDNNCNNCETFHLNNLKKINKTKDINIGNKLEDHFQEFINNIFNSYSIDLHCQRADRNNNLHMPDFKINDASENPIFYFEFKVIFRPFLKISSSVDSLFECYSHSMTLDISNGKKLENQKILVEQIGLHKTAYVYWYDLPCIKGLFWMPAERVYHHFNNQILYKRKLSSGDFSSRGNKTGATNKIYLPLLEMYDFSSLIKVFESAANHKK